MSKVYDSIGRSSDADSKQVDRNLLSLKLGKRLQYLSGICFLVLGTKKTPGVARNTRSDPSKLFYSSFFQTLPPLMTTFRVSLGLAATMMSLSGFLLYIFMSAQAPSSMTPSGASL